jgi:hypothetical protein
MEDHADPHGPAARAGLTAEAVQFSPTDAADRTREIVRKNLEATR